LVQAFLKKWWVESDFKAPSLPLSLRLKVSNNTMAKRKRTKNNNVPQTIKQKTKDRATRTPLTPRVNGCAPGKVSSFCIFSDMHCVTLITITVKEEIVIMKKTEHI
jgi:hypothetical protein